MEHIVIRSNCPVRIMLMQLLKKQSKNPNPTIRPHLPPLEAEIKKIKNNGSAHFNLMAAKSKFKWQKVSINKLLRASYSHFSFITYLETIHLQQPLDQHYIPFHSKTILTSDLLDVVGLKKKKKRQT